MEVTRYLSYFQEHVDLMSILYVSREMPFPEYSLPNVGFIATEAGIPLAAGFLRTIEGNMGFFDSFITNSHALSCDRDEALDKIIECLMEFAKIWGWKSILCFTAQDSLYKRSLEYGFMPRPWSCSILEGI